ncbi:MAG: tetratricopeptide repeat protein [Thermoanaerobaculia bacterium]
MTADLWVPGAVILAVGAAVGWWVTRRYRGAGTGKRRTGSAGTATALEVADLEQRRDDLYARLKEAGLPTETRTDLELQAARVLKRLDEVGGGRERRAAPSDAHDAGESSRPAPVAHSRAHTLITGFVFGGGTVALIALLVFWAGRDARPKEPQAGAMQPRPTVENPHPEAVLPVQIAEEVGELQARIAAEPGDIEARKRLALLYLGNDLYIEAFEEADAVLGVAPDDIDSLYVQGVVRMTMGQDEEALFRLDRVLELFPQHVRAMTVKGLIFARRGERDQAAAIWNQALEVGGPQPQIQNLLAMLESEGSGELPPGHPPAEGGAIAGAASAAAGIPRNAYTARIEADTIAGFPQTGVVFVSLRPVGGGSPVAVRRIDQPAFPMLVSVGPDNMMMAGASAELPAEGLLVVRLDQDGSASTKGENDLEGSAEMSRGDLVTIFLD